MSCNVLPLKNPERLASDADRTAFLNRTFADSESERAPMLFSEECSDNPQQYSRVLWPKVALEATVRMDAALLRDGVSFVTLDLLVG